MRLGACAETHLVPISFLRECRHLRSQALEAHVGTEASLVPSMGVHLISLCGEMVRSDTSRQKRTQLRSSPDARQQGGARLSFRPAREATRSPAMLRRAASALARSASQRSVSLQRGGPASTRTVNGLVPIVLEQTGRGERAYDIYSRLLKAQQHPFVSLLVAGENSVCHARRQE